MAKRTAFYFVSFSSATETAITATTSASTAAGITFLACPACALACQTLVSATGAIAGRALYHASTAAKSAFVTIAKSESKNSQNYQNN